MATGALAVAMQAACRLVAASATFQTLCGSPGNAAAALAHTHWPDWDFRTNTPLPIAAIWAWEGMVNHKRGFNRSESGHLMLSLYGPVIADPTSVSQADLQAWVAQADAIPDEMLDLAGDPLPDGSGFHFGLTETLTIVPPGWIDNTDCPQEIPACGIAMYQLSFGIR